MALRLRRQSAGTDGAACDVSADEYAIVLRALVDRRAFAPLYERHVDAIYRHCHRRLGEREAAEDLTGLVFRKALEGLHSFHGGSFKAWLFTIADNALRDAKRSRAARPTSPLIGEVDWLDPAPGPEELAIERLDREGLRLALAELPDEWRRVVELRLDGFSCADVARMIGNGRTTEWARQTHHRAVERLRQIMLGRPATKGGAR